MDKHITLAAVFHIGFGVLGLFFAVVVLVVVGGSGLISGDRQAMAITTGIASIIAFVLFITSIPGIIGGIGLLKRKSWARILLLIVGVVDLFDIPIGTALGIYTLWVLLQEETVQILKGKTATLQPEAPLG